ncbi:hypothetical protein NWF32_01765 [Pseudomonas qingdaonensis]|nr:hypothetical protein [Pseudomonas qingdaonensis]
MNQLASQAGIYLASDAALTAGKQSRPVTGASTLSRPFTACLPARA